LCYGWSCLWWKFCFPPIIYNCKLLPWFHTESPTGRQ
jgi:hypothetical protein